ncbi:acyl carrier protein [Actinosynnema sp. NPDC023658]|uniref:acyl carrier protein n=1 Tax=Actinosynnema sp. NPDC023658 TaxID=3155465 RepID=UPI0033E3282E
MTAVDANGRDEVGAAVKRMVVAESRLTIDPATVDDTEPLNGEVLRVTSVGFLSMLIRLEDELGVTLPDDLFAGRTFRTVADLVDVVAPTYADQRAG